MVRENHAIQDTKPEHLVDTEISREIFIWVIQATSMVHRKPFSPEQLARDIVPPYSRECLYKVMQENGFDIRREKLRMSRLARESFPLLAWMQATAPDGRQLTVPALLLQADGEKVLFVTPLGADPVSLPVAAFCQKCEPEIVRIMLHHEDSGDVDADDIGAVTRKFGFRWFVPELLRHKQIWHEILLASLVIQLIALATPLFTQAIIDKVIVNRTQSTLVVIAFGMVAFMLFSSLLTWLRQYLVLHTGNRVDAVLGSTVFTHLLRLPPVYFQHRPTGVISARLHGIETIREFISSAAVTLMLDLPFLLIFVAVMLYYSVMLTLIVLVILLLIVSLSIFVAPLFQKKLQEQFQKGAKNQAFLTEYIAGMETVKSLQLEPQLGARYSIYLADFLKASFSAKQLGNTYSTLANGLEQLMSLLILGIGAYTVMNSSEFTVGMLVAFQMFANKLSQPMLRLVGLWQQFQQARLSVERLGDLMNAPTEPYTYGSQQQEVRRGEVVIEQLAFRYDKNQPFLYENLNLCIAAGKTVSIMGPSGSGKSTLAKLLQGFYQPEQGRILVDGVDISHLSANALRVNFGVVPQETTLFSGTLYDNLHMANPMATQDDIVQACTMAEIHDVIERLPKGYQTEIGERGAGLSGGQKQRIAIARALLKKPGILVFDEATSALDEHTAAQFANTINSLKGKMTIVFITHGLPDNLQIDVRYRLKKDRIVTEESA